MPKKEKIPDLGFLFYNPWFYKKWHSMVGSEKEVAFRKRRRDYSVKGRRNPIRDSTIVTVKRDAPFIRPESLVAKKRQITADKKKVEINSKRKASVNFPLPEENDKFALVLRVVPKKDYICPESHTILTELRLNEQFDGCFVLLTPEMKQKLQKISHLVIYGIPTLELIRQLIHTKAFITKDGVEVALTSNKAVSDALSDKGVECLDDIVHSLSNVEPSFEDVSKFLSPFHFNKIGVEKPRMLASAGGISGWNRDGISEYIQKIL